MGKRMAYYSATKAAVHSFTQSLRYRLPDTNVRVIELVLPAVDMAMSELVLTAPLMLITA